MKNLNTYEDIKNYVIENYGFEDIVTIQIFQRIERGASIEYLRAYLDMIDIMYRDGWIE